MVAVKVERLSKRFGQVVALADVSIEVQPGELFFLLGPSGCGKTTLLRCIAGLCEPDSGRIWLGESEITNLPANRRDTAMVFQNYALWPHMTVEQNVAFGLEVRGVPAEQRKRQTIEALELVQMAHLAKRKPNELSGGQQQRVALARALVVKPRCLLLDEPLSNLDAKLRAEMRVQIRRLCKQLGLTAIYVTHDQKEALCMADRIAVMRDGKIEQTGSPVQLYERPANRFVAEFIGETNFLTGRVLARRDGMLEVDTDAGRILATAGTQAAATEGTVTVSIRPEALRIVTDSAPAGESVNRFAGTVLESVYFGEVTQHEVLVNGKVRLKVLQLKGARLAEQRRQVQLEFSADDAVVLAD